MHEPFLSFWPRAPRGPIPIFSQADHCHFHVLSENRVNSHHVLQSTDWRYSFHCHVHVLSDNHVNSHHVLQSIDCTSWNLPFKVYKNEVNLQLNENFKKHSKLWVRKAWNTRNIRTYFICAAKFLTFLDGGGVDLRWQQKSWWRA